VALVLVASVSFTGCGGDSLETHAVSGTVQHDGKPLSNVGVTFTPWDGTAGPPAVGRTDENGNFTLSTFGEEDGAVTGTHRVTVAVVGSASGEEGPTSADEYAPAPPPPFPKKYMTPDSSDIEVNVPADTDAGDLKIELK